MSLGDQIYNASEELCKPNQVERATDRGSRNLEMENTEMYQDFAKQQVESNGYGSQGHEIHKIDETNEGRDSCPETDDGSISQVTQILLKGKGNKFQGTSSSGSEEKKASRNWRGEMKHEIPVKDDEQMRKFNQQKPDFFPLIPNTEREKVNLKHKMMDERKSAEQWMLDHALRQAVTELAPVRKSKVALLVEAFETVMPTPKIQTHTKKGSASSHARNIQA
ncbi:calmodulin binding protein PICBP-like [Prosopis cineraria]|uniref:calmodulin binding protein PICBP-like n=1 Tax=Prosopis cineraria TaxID=364024 RepID=UPI00240EA68B|nr:calmodulin binding protein PICBP-like [Prosopis cineraria]